MQITIEVPETLTFTRHDANCEYLVEELPEKALTDIFLMGFQRHLDIATAPVNSYVEAEGKEGRTLTLAEATSELADKRWQALVSGEYGTRQGGPRKDAVETEYLKQAFAFLRQRKWKAEKARESTKSRETFHAALLDMALRLEAGQRGIKVADLDKTGQDAASARAMAKSNELEGIAVANVATVKKAAETM